MFSCPLHAKRVLLCLSVSAFVCLTHSGCERAPQITTYTAPKDSSTGRPFSCSVPIPWILGTNDRFSALAFESKAGARITVSSLKGSGDEFLKVNVNRWRRQVALDPVDSVTDLDTVSLKNGEAQFVNLTGESKALQGAIVEHGGKMWFFKMSGTVAAVADQADEFSEFLKSVEFFDRS